MGWGDIGGEAPPGRRDTDWDEKQNKKEEIQDAIIWIITGVVSLVCIAGIASTPWSAICLGPILVYSGMTFIVLSVSWLGERHRW